MRVTSNTAELNLLDGVSTLYGSGALGIGSNSNIGIGAATLSNLSSGSESTAVGYSALQDNFWFSKTQLLVMELYIPIQLQVITPLLALGEACSTIRPAITNASFGSRSLTNNTSGHGNAAFGYYALNANTTGNSNSAFGSNTLK